MADSGQQFRNITRREFLNYIWAGSMAMVLAATGGAMFAFSLPRFKEGEFGGIFVVGTMSEKLPKPDSPPVAYPDVKVWLVNIGPEEAKKGGGIEGLAAMYKVCVHLGCLYAWVDSTVRYECPCHGSKYHEDGTYIEGPAPRDLDRFRVVIQDGKGNLVAQTVNDAASANYGAPIPIPPNSGDYVIKVDTGAKINLGKRYFYRGGPAV